jgi:hypothetical protein
MINLLLSFHISLIYYWNFFDLHKLQKYQQFSVHTIFILNNLSLIYDFAYEPHIFTQILILMLSDVHRYVNDLVYSLVYLSYIIVHQNIDILLILNFVKSLIKMLFLYLDNKEKKLKDILKIQIILFIVCLNLVYYIDYNRYCMYYVLYRLIKLSNLTSKRVVYDYYSKWTIFDDILLPQFIVNRSLN